MSDWQDPPHRTEQTIKHEGYPYQFVVLPPFQGQATMNVPGSDARMTYGVPYRVMRVNMETGEAWLLDNDGGQHFWQSIGSSSPGPYRPSPSSYSPPFSSTPPEAT